MVRTARASGRASFRMSDCRPVPHTLDRLRSRQTRTWAASGSSHTQVSEAPPNTAKSLYATLKDDVQVVHRDVKQRGIRRVLGEPITRAEEFYHTSSDRERLAAMRPLRRTFSRTWWLFRGLLLKLTPAR